MKQLLKPIILVRLVLAALLLLAADVFVLPLLRAQPGTTPMTNAAPSSSTTAAATTTVAMAGTNAAPVSQTNASASTSPAPATNAAAASTNAPASGNEESPPAPGEMSGPAAAEPSEPIGPPAPYSATSTSQEPGQIMPYQTNNPAVQDITNQPGAEAGLGQRKLPFYFGLDVGEMYDDNILISPDNERKSSFITHVSPSLDYQLGDSSTPHANYLNLYFSPTVYIYHNQDRVNRIDYVGDIYYQYTWTRLQLGFEQNYQHLTDATLDEGTLVSRNIYTTKLTASYAYNDDLSLYGTGTQQVNNYPGITINEWDADTYALYQVAPKLSLGAGPRLAFLDITGQPNETHEDLLFRLRYVPDQRFTVSFDGGAEYLQYQGSQADRLFPIFDANLTYAVFEDTSLFLSAGRTEENSFDLNGDLFDYTTINVGVSQKFLQNFTFTATGGYSLSQYQSTAQTGGSGRRDNYLIGKASVQWDPNRWLTVEGSYQWSKDNSTDGQFTFTDNQIDLQSSVKF